MENPQSPPRFVSESVIDEASVNICRKIFSSNVKRSRKRANSISSPLEVKQFLALSARKKRVRHTRNKSFGNKASLEDLLSVVSDHQNLDDSNKSNTTTTRELFKPDVFSDQVISKPGMRYIMMKRKERFERQKEKRMKLKKLKEAKARANNLSKYMGRYKVFGVGAVDVVSVIKDRMKNWIIGHIIRERMKAEDMAAEKIKSWYFKTLPLYQQFQRHWSDVKEERMRELEKVREEELQKQLKAEKEAEKYEEEQQEEEHFFHHIENIVSRIRVDEAVEEKDQEIEDILQRINEVKVEKLIESKDEEEKAKRKKKKRRKKPGQPPVVRLNKKTLALMKQQEDKKQKELMNNQPMKSKKYQHVTSRYMALFEKNSSIMLNSTKVKEVEEVEEVEEEKALSPSEEKMRELKLFQEREERKRKQREKNIEMFTSRISSQRNCFCAGVEGQESNCIML